MNKLFTKIATAFVGMAMAVGVGVALGSGLTNSKEVKMASATEYTYNKVALADIADGDEVLIVSYYNSAAWYYLPSATTSSAPTASEVTVTSSTITGDYDEHMFIVGGTGSTRTFFNGEKYLTNTSNNNGVRINVTNASNWTITATTNGYKMTNNDRWLGVYNGADWRSYGTSNAANYKNSGEWINFYRKAAPSEDPAFTLDKDLVNLTLGGNSTTVTATPNQYVDNNATYSWTRTAGDDCVTLTNADTATVTIAPKGNAVYASCTLTIAVTGCTSKTVSVSVKKVSTSENPFTVAEAKTVIDGGIAADMTGVYVHGIISQVDSYNGTYHSITYWISDDGTTEGQLEVYSGKGLSGANFNSKDDLEVGYEVVVTGDIKLFNDVYEFDKNNELVSLVIPGAHSVSTTTEGLTLSTDSVGESGSVTLTTAGKKKGSNVVVTGATSSIEGNVVSLSEVTSDVTINATIVDAEIASLAVSNQKTKFGLDEDFSFDGPETEGVLTATYDDWCSPHTEEQVLEVFTIDASAFQKGVAGTYEITVSYGGKEVSYNVTVTDIFDPSKGDYHLVTALNQLSDGAHIAIVDAASEYVMKKGFTSTNNVTANEITVEDNVIAEASKEFVLDIELVEVSENNYRFKLDDDLYLYAASSSSNHLKAASLATSGNNGVFEIGLTAGVFSIVAQGSNTRNTMFFNPNSGSPLFSCYGSKPKDGLDVAIYVFEKNAVGPASEFADTFLSAFTCNAQGTSKPTFALKQGETYWSWALLEEEFNTLSDEDKNLFKLGEASESGSNIQKALARYDYIVGKYYKTGLDLNFVDFMVRNPAAVSGARIGGNSITSSTNNIIIIVVVASVLSLAAVSGCLLLRRRKHK